MPAFVVLALMLLTSWGKACEVHIAQQENLYKIPSHLLKAIAYIESGMTKGKNHKVAWPWTINVNGKGYRFKTKHEAIQAVEKLKSEGITSIDVGCMQINLKHHPHAFKDLNEAFDVQKNVNYGAKFLSDLKQKLGTWQKAIAYYHSATPEFHIPYQEKVTSQWNELRKNKGIISPIPVDEEYDSVLLPHKAMPLLSYQKRKPIIQDVQQDSTPRKFYPIASTTPLKAKAIKMKKNYATATMKRFYPLHR